MNYYTSHPMMQTPHTPHHLQPTAHQATSFMQYAAMGATVGAAAAAASQLHQADGHHAVTHVVRAGIVSGLTTGVVGCVKDHLGGEKTLPTFAAMFAVGTAMMYALNSSSE